MNIDQLENKWDEMKGKVKEKWGKFTNDDMLVIKGKKDQLVAKLRERYNYTAEQAKTELNTFFKDYKSTPTSKPKLKERKISKA